MNFYNFNEINQRKEMTKKIFVAVGVFVLLVNIFTA